MAAGGYNRRVLIERRTTAPLDGFGHQPDTWTTVGHVWARVQPMSGREQVRAMQVGPSFTWEVIVRYHRSFDTPDAVGWRIKYQTPGATRVLNIVSLRDHEDKRIELVFNCVEASANGQ